MGKKSGIDYVDASWGPWYGGCKPRGPECLHCYAKREMAAYGRDPEVLTKSIRNFDAPARWQKHKRIFVCPWSDFFLAAADSWRPAAWDVIRRSPQHVFIIPTKRPERIADHLPPGWGEGWPNVWLVLSAGTHESLERWAEVFFNVPAAVHGLSCEPLLGDLADDLPNGLDWVLTGCESDPNRRPTKIQWVEKIVDLCELKNLPVFVKQLDLGDGLIKMPEVLGRVWDQYPHGYDEADYTTITVEQGSLF